MIEEFTYSNESFHQYADQHSISQFDKMLQKHWTQKMEKDCFRYKLGDLKTKCLDGKYNFVLQLNEKRATERRKPQFVTDIVMPFDPENFHFGKVPNKEVICYISPLKWKEDVYDKADKKSRHILLINVSPLEYCHSLLVPSLESNFPQVLNFTGLRLAVEVMLTSSSRVGYNSLGALASVNHQHFHVYYLKHKLYLESVPLNLLEGPCYALECHPSKGFVFEILKMDSILEVVRSVMVLVEFLIKKKIPHNIFLTRALKIKDPRPNVYESIRIYVWARAAHYGEKDGFAFSIAICELAGHIPIKDEKSFESLTENDIAESLSQECHAMFDSIKDEVKKLYRK